MTNYERIIALPKEELAWVLMNNCTSAGDNGCDLCLWKRWSDSCGDRNRSCIDGHREFLDRETTEEDEVIYAIARNNVVISKHNAMPAEDFGKYKVIYREVNGKRYADRMELRDE